MKMKMNLGQDMRLKTYLGSNEREYDYSSGRSYNPLTNKPQINGVTLIGNLPLEAFGLRAVYYDTTENWNLQAGLIGERGAIYIYSDYQTIYDDVGNPTFIPGIRIGDGTSYLIDRPFVSEVTADLLLDHISNTHVHLTDEERYFWNDKVTCYQDPDDPERVIFTKGIPPGGGARYPTVDEALVDYAILIE